MFTNFLYPWARQAFLTGDLGWDDNAYYIMFLNAGVGTATIYSNTSGTAVTGYAAEPNAYTGNWAGWSVTWLNQIPYTHRTFYNASTRPEYGGSGSTHVLTTSVADGNGVADASDITLLQVPTGTAVSAFVIYRRPVGADAIISGYASTAAQDGASRLVAYFGSAVGMPVNANGGDITIQWDNTSTTKVFRL